MIKRPEKQSLGDLQKKLPQWNGDAGWLNRILNEMDERSPRYRYRVRVFRLFWGLMPEGPVLTTEIAKRYHVDRRTIHTHRVWTLRRLKDPKWWGDEYRHLRDP